MFEYYIFEVCDTGPWTKAGIVRFQAIGCVKFENYEVLIKFALELYPLNWVSRFLAKSEWEKNYFCVGVEC